MISYLNLPEGATHISKPDVRIANGQFTVTFYVFRYEYSVLMCYDTYGSESGCWAIAAQMFRRVPEIITL